MSNNSNNSHTIVNFQYCEKNLIPANKLYIQFFSTYYNINL